MIWFIPVSAVLSEFPEIVKNARLFGGFHLLLFQNEPQKGYLTVYINLTLKCDNFLFAVWKQKALEGWKWHKQSLWIPPPKKNLSYKMKQHRFTG